jgi:ketosteroid isomerase-like protein
MSTPSKTLIDLENKFWQSMVAQDAEAATQMLNEPALMVSSHGAMKFDHAGYRRMAEQGSRVLTSFELSDVDVMFPTDTTAIVSYHVKQELATRGGQDGALQEMNDTSTWVKKGSRWQCVMHTETPAQTQQAPH